MNKKKFYITSTLPYVNAEPHIGFALEIIQADAIARYKEKKGYEVFFNTGTDEHGQKIYSKAIENKQDPKEYVDYYAAKFDNLKQALNLSYNNFIRTTDEHHKKAAQEFWKRCFNKGDIYKDKYPIKYCVGCELEKTDSELINEKCPIHPNLEIQLIEEENYFFRFSKYQEPLLKLYEKNPQFVLPDFRFNEIKEFVKQGLKDFSISRLKEKMPWGVEVPGDNKQVMYVWFDALVNYISALGWPENEKKFSEFWPGIQIAGKDNLRQQSAMWQAMLISAGLPNSKQILIHGFMTVAGQKISKSLGNVVNPIEVTKKYGAEALRYYLLKEVPTFDDGDYSEEKLIQLYNADLANGLGNLVSRITKLCEDSKVIYNINLPKYKSDFTKNQEMLNNLMKKFKLNEVCKLFESQLTEINKLIHETKPWENVEGSTDFLESTLNKTVYLVNLFSFIFPNTNQKVIDHLSYGRKMNLNASNKVQVRHLTGLFPRI